MDGYNLTERSRKILTFARTDAERRGHAHVAPAHIALGLIEEGQGVACAILENHRVSIGDLRRDLEMQLPPAATHHDRATDIPFTAAGKKVMERSMAAARELKHSYVGTEHLLLALLDPVAEDVRTVFAKHGMTHENATAETLRLLGPTPPSN